MSFAINVGDRVEIDKGRIGTVRYVGEIHVKPGTWVGIELRQPEGQHDGKLEGQRYFKAPENHGTFVNAIASLYSAVKICRRSCRQLRRIRTFWADGGGFGLRV